VILYYSELEEGEKGGKKEEERLSIAKTCKREGEGTDHELITIPCTTDGSSESYSSSPISMRNAEMNS